MLSSVFLLLVLAAAVGAGAALHRSPSRPRLAGGLLGWLVLELLVALATWVLAGLDSGAAARHDLAVGGAICAALLIVPILQVRRYRRGSRLRDRPPHDEHLA